jgi:hypothetical protein
VTTTTNYGLPLDFSLASIIHEPTGNEFFSALPLSRGDHMSTRFSLRTFLVLFLILAAGLAFWQRREQVKLVPLVEARDRALVEWRVVKNLYDLHGAQLAADEAVARARYFDNRAKVEAAVTASSWPGYMLVSRTGRAK